MGTNPVIKRPLMLTAIVFVAVLCVLMSISIEICSWVSVAFTVVFLILALLLLFGAKARSLAFCLAFLALASVWISVYRRTSELPSVEFLKEYADTGKEFEFRGEIIDMSGGDNYAVYTVMLSEPCKIKARLTSFSSEKCSEGETIVGSAVAERPQEISGKNFEEERYLKSDGIFVKLSAKSEITPISSGSAGFIDGMKSKIDGALLKYVAKKDNLTSYELSRGLLFGDKSGIRADIKESFSRSGISHILTVSGLHFSVLMLIIMRTLSFLRTPKPLKVIAFIAIAFFYMAIADFGLPVIRSGIMAFMLNIGELFGKKADPLTSLSFAAIAIGLISPFTIYDVGASMSFLATAGILCCSGVFLRLSSLGRGFWSRILGGVLSSFVVTCAAVSFMLPVTLPVFNEISTVGAIVNLITAVPVFLMLLMLLLIAIFSSLPFGICSVVCTLCGFAVNALSELLLFVARLFSNMRFSAVDVPHSRILSVVFGVVVFAFLLIPIFVNFSKARYILFVCALIYPCLICVMLPVALTQYSKPCAMIAYDNNGSYLALREHGGFLYIPTDSDSAYHYNKSGEICDEYNGNNTYLIAERGCIDITSLCESIKKFNARYGISRLVIPYSQSVDFSPIITLADSLDIPYEIYYKAFCFGDSTLEFNSTDDSFTITVSHYNKKEFVYCVEDRFTVDSLEGSIEKLPLYVYASRKKIPDGNDIPPEFTNVFTMYFKPDFGNPMEKNMTTLIYLE